MTPPLVQLLHVEFIDQHEAPTGDYWLARWTCEHCGTRGDLAGARVGVDGVPLRERGHEHARAHRCDGDALAAPREAVASLLP